MSETGLSPCPIARLTALEEENARLRREVEFLRGHPTIARGLKGESLIAGLASARFARKGSGHDLEQSGSGLLFEVKYSSLLRVAGDRPVRRWAWTKFFGERSTKQYDRLLLVGEADSRYMEHYADPSSPYVLFDLPYAAAVELAGVAKPGRAGGIHLASNPVTARSPRASEMFCEFQVTTAEIRRRYAC